MIYYTYYILYIIHYILYIIYYILYIIHYTLYIIYYILYVIYYILYFILPLPLLPLPRRGKIVQSSNWERRRLRDPLHDDCLPPQSWCTRPSRRLGVSWNMIRAHTTNYMVTILWLPHWNKIIDHSRVPTLDPFVRVFSEECLSLLAELVQQGPFPRVLW